MDKIQTRFFETLDTMEQPGSCFLAADLTVFGFCIELSYPREDFVKDVKEILKNLSPQQQIAETRPFNFVIDNVFFNGCPTPDNNGNAAINDCVKKFVLNNKISVKNNIELSACIDAITKALPEFLSLIGKIQHHTHDYSVDVHTLKVLQGAMSDKRYKTLSSFDRRVLQLAILLHDLTKKEGEIDKTHPECAALAAAEILKRFDIAQNLKDRIVLIIRQHDWLERYNKGITSADEFAHILKDGNNFLMECIFAKYDLIAVQRSGFFYERFKDVLSQGELEISLLINKGLSVA